MFRRLQGLFRATGSTFNIFRFINKEQIPWHLLFTTSLFVLEQNQRNANVPYELHSVTNAEWGGGGKTSDQLTVFGQLPSITTPSGKLISQTGALVRYTARLCQLVPTDDDLVT